MSKDIPLSPCPNPGTIQVEAETTLGENDTSPSRHIQVSPTGRENMVDLVPFI